MPLNVTGQLIVLPLLVICRVVADVDPKTIPFAVAPSVMPVDSLKSP
jgi:hypothetical protein